jgi:cell division protein FtsB
MESRLHGGRFNPYLTFTSSKEPHMTTKSIPPVHLLATAAVLVSAVASAAIPFSPVRQDAAQLQADEAALQRQVKRLESDHATLEADTASGRMSATSEDAYQVYSATKAVSGEKKDIAADEPGSLQLKADKAALDRELRRLDAAEARLKADTAEGKMAAESADSERVYQDRQALKAEEAQVTDDVRKLGLDERT